MKKFIIISCLMIFCSCSKNNETYYNVTFKNFDETILYECNVKKNQEAIYQGEIPKKDGDDEFDYKFIGWDQSLLNINSDLITYAQYETVIKNDWGEIKWF